MLLAVAGGFFSALASGYSCVLTNFLLDQKKEEKLMRVSPWNDYQLDQESNSVLQLASTKNWLAHSCTSFVCFGSTATSVDSPSPLKGQSTQRQDVLPEPGVSEKGKYDLHNSNPTKDDNNGTKVAIKSNLKKPRNNISFSGGADNGGKALGEKVSDIPGHTKARKVQWTDISGGDLVEIREFELSDTGGSDNEFDNRSQQTCSCMIM